MSDTNGRNGKKFIGGYVKTSVANSVKALAKKQNRSTSNMLELILSMGVHTSKQAK